MIFDSLFTWIVNGVVSLIQLMPTVDIPTWVSTTVSLWSDMLEGAAGMSHWINFPAIASAATFILGATLISISLKIIRMVISLASGGGGSAA